MPATCLGATQPDNAIISAQLIPLIGQIQVADSQWFATHSPVIFSVQLAQSQLFTKKLQMPASWIEFALEKDKIAQAVDDTVTQLCHVALIR